MKRTKPSATKAKAIAAIRRAIAHGWAEESTACDYAVNALVADGAEYLAAVRAVDAAWLDNFAITEAN